MNEAWKDVYNWLTEKSDDYFFTLTTIPLQQAIPAAPLNPNEYLVALPADFYKLRTLDYNSAGSWQPMPKFALESRNNYNTVMSYRFQGENLWIVGGLFNGGAPLLRLGYYPAITPIYFPDQAVDFTANSGLNDAQLSTCQYIEYITSGNVAVVSEQGTGLLAISNTTNTPTNILTTAVTLSNIVYYKGYLYWVQAGNVWGAPFTPTAVAALTPVQLTSTGTVTYMDIQGSNTAYLVEGTVAKSASVSGTSTWTTGAIGGVPASVLAYFTIGVSAGWVTSAGALVYGGATLVASGVTDALTDGVYIYYLQSSVLYRYTISTQLSEVLATDVSYISDVSNGYIGIIQGEALTIQAISTVPDYVISYPNNIVSELIAYQMAMDFKRKQDNQTGMESIANRITELKERFLDVATRDDRFPERINVSQRRANLPGLTGGM